MSLILPNLYLGNILDAKNKDLEKSLGITHVVSILSRQGLVKLQKRLGGTLEWMPIKCCDIEKELISENFELSHEFISNALQSGGSVLIHCRAGISRSATICIAYLMKSRNWSLAQAIKYCTEKRSIVCPNRGFLKQLEDYEADLMSKL